MKIPHHVIEILRQDVVAFSYFQSLGVVHKEHLLDVLTLKPEQLSAKVTEHGPLVVYATTECKGLAVSMFITHNKLIVWASSDTSVRGAAIHANINIGSFAESTWSELIQDHAEIYLRSRYPELCYSGSLASKKLTEPLFEYMRNLGIDLNLPVYEIMVTNTIDYGKDTWYETVLGNYRLVFNVSQGYAISMPTDDNGCFRGFVQAEPEFLLNPDLRQVLHNVLAVFSSRLALVDQSKLKEGEMRLYNL